MQDGNTVDLCVHRAASEATKMQMCVKEAERLWTKF